MGTYTVALTSLCILGSPYYIYVTAYPPLENRRIIPLFLGTCNLWHPWKFHNIIGHTCNFWNVGAGGLIPVQGLGGQRREGGMVYGTWVVFSDRKWNDDLIQYVNEFTHLQYSYIHIHVTTQYIPVPVSITTPLQKTTRPSVNQMFLTTYC